MFILIDIPEDVYKRCKEYQLFCGEAEILEAAVARGILPESSGDYISRAAVLSKINEVCFSEKWLQFRVNKGSNGQRDYIINYIVDLPSFEVWNGIHGQTIAPKGTFEKIYNECKDEEDDI